LEKIQVRKIEVLETTAVWPFFDWSLLWGILSFWVSVGIGPYGQEWVLALKLLPSWMGMAFRWFLIFS